MDDLGKIKNGTKFTVCNHEELMKKGWFKPSRSGSYEHNDYNGVITQKMIDQNHGKTLTVNGHINQNWYSVEENDWQWPVDVFDEVNGHLHIEGMTPIDGWFICKTCGDNLREIK